MSRKYSFSEYIIRTDLGGQMVGQTKRQRHQGERRIGPTYGGENAAPDDVKIVVFVRPAVGVDDSVFFFLRHPRRSEMMIGMKHSFAILDRTLAWVAPACRANAFELSCQY